MIHIVWVSSMNIKLVDGAVDIPNVPAGSVIGFDIETSPKRELIKEGHDVLLDPRMQSIVLAQLAIGDTVYVLRNNFASLKSLLEDKRVIKVIHNASFEYKFMMHLGVYIQNIFDTMLVEGIVENGHIPPLSLEAVAKKYLNMSLNKKVRQKFVSGSQLDRDMLKYAAEDAYVLPQLYRILVELPEFEGQQRVVKLEHALVPVAAAIEYNGIGFDAVRWQDNAEHAQVDYAATRREFLTSMPARNTQRISLTGDTYTDDNINSREFILSVFQSAGIELPDLKKLTIQDALQSYDHPLLKLYAKFKLLNKRVTTYGLPFLDHINPETGRIHQHINQLVARTGRLAGSG